MLRYYIKRKLCIQSCEENNNNLLKSNQLNKGINHNVTILMSCPCASMKREGCKFGHGKIRGCQWPNRGGCHFRNLYPNLKSQCPPPPPPFTVDSPHTLLKSRVIVTVTDNLLKKVFIPFPYKRGPPSALCVS